MNISKPTVSIIIPAYNEEEHLNITFEKTVAVLATEAAEYEIIIVDDGSTDRTAAIADDLAEKHPQVRVIHNPGNRGFGFTCRAGIQAARMTFTGWIAADTAWDPAVLKKVIGMLNQYDIITAYTQNSYNRPLSRRIISVAFTTILNVLFGLRLRYYNGACFHRTLLLQSIPLLSSGYTLWAEAIIRLVKKGYRCYEIGGNFDDRKSGETKAFRLQNVVGTLKFIGMLVKDVYFNEGWGNYFLHSVIARSPGVRRRSNLTRREIASPQKTGARNDTV